MRRLPPRADETKVVGRLQAGSSESSIALERLHLDEQSSDALTHPVRKRRARHYAKASRIYLKTLPALCPLRFAHGSEQRRSLVLRFQHTQKDGLHGATSRPFSRQ